MSKKRLTKLGQQLFKDHYLLLKKVLPQSTCQILSQRIWSLAIAQQLKPCKLCLSSTWLYEDICFSEVHQALKPAIEKSLGLELLCGFNSVRLYSKNETLKKHLDREAAEFILSITIDFKGEQRWPLYFSQTEEEGQQQSVELEISDGVLFRGHQLYHWRLSLENDWQIQAFFSFVDANGPFKEHADDMIAKYETAD